MKTDIEAIRGRSLLPLKSGVDYQLEQIANELLTQDRSRGNVDWLSEDQLELRARREIGNHIGLADAALIAGMYRRAYNPLAGTRPGKKGRSHDDG